MKKNAILATIILLSCFNIEHGGANQSQNSIAQIGSATGEKQLGDISSTSGGQGIVTVKDETDENWWSRQPKKKKMLYTNLTAVTAIGIFGLATWDYDSAGFKTENEGWFGHDTKYGGADKFSHM